MGRSSNTRESASRSRGSSEKSNDELPDEQRTLDGSTPRASATTATKGSECVGGASVTRRGKLSRSSAKSSGGGEKSHDDNFDDDPVLDRDRCKKMLTRVATAALRAPRPAAGLLQPALTASRMALPSATTLLSSRRWLCSGGEMDVPIPELGAESIVEGGILSIAKNVGDYVAAEEMVAEIETGTGPFPSASRDPPIWLLHSLTQRMLR